MAAGGRRASAFTLQGAPNVSRRRRLKIHRGVADGFALKLKWDWTSQQVRLGDVIENCSVNNDVLAHGKLKRLIVNDVLVV